VRTILVQRLSRFVLERLVDGQLRDLTALLEGHENVTRVQILNTHVGPKAPNVVQYLD
jgi:hypothetical protein